MMNRKSKTVIFTIVLGVITISSISWYKIADQKITYQSIDAKQVSFKTVDEMINFSELIITGEPLESENFVTFDENGYTEDAYTVTKIKINKVLENKSGNEYNEGDVIKVAEPTYVFDNGIKPGKTIYAINEYQLMNKNNEYMLLLTQDVKYDDLYVISGVNEGKQNIDVSGNDGEKTGVPQEEKNYEFKEELKAQFGITD
ncbi:hypothetical protein [Paenibacillus sp. BR1-192]|uniref:hypothetical protein n=1 Tax=Paenibacillus sp. BR1-192 TaxID=3032287 RepID=UPI00240D170F|nr:hypothetical protein [Paenibacillus sp. BR1-192]WFB59040.1 hypothetical protein P0X86_02005 [Paenibacillus sp. BR1-192]